MKLPITLWILAIVLSAWSPLIIAEPWIDTRDQWLRSDIERLAQAQIIRAPINTWPLMWPSLLEDLSDTPLAQIPKRLTDSHARVLAAGTAALRLRRSHVSARAAGANSAQTFRHYGASNGDRSQLVLRNHLMSVHFASNLEIGLLTDPWDDDRVRFDHSYIGLAWGNWVTLFGAIDRWWGPAWSSNLIISNNARPTPGFTLKRNYSDPSELPILKHLGPWTSSFFISQLDDRRHIEDAKLVGMTLGWRPVPSFEVNFRRTAQWGGNGRPQSASNFFKLLSGTSDNCTAAECKDDEPGNQLGGVDLRWNLPWLTSSIYAQAIGEDEAGGLPSRRAHQLGMQFTLDATIYSGIAFVEFDDTRIGSYEQHYNILYNHNIYKTGYRYRGRAIGSTWDNDSQIVSIGTIGRFNNGDSLELRYSHGKINRDSHDWQASSQHSISPNGGSLRTLSARWRRTLAWGELEFSARYTDDPVDQYGRQAEKLRVVASATYGFD